MGRITTTQRCLSIAADERVVCWCLLFSGPTGTEVAEHEFLLLPAPLWELEELPSDLADVLCCQHPESINLSLPGTVGSLRLLEPAVEEQTPTRTEQEIAYADLGVLDSSEYDLRVFTIERETWQLALPRSLIQRICSSFAGAGLPQPAITLHPCVMLANLQRKSSGMYQIVGERHRSWIAIWPNGEANAASWLFFPTVDQNGENTNQLLTRLGAVDRVVSKPLPCMTFELDQQDSKLDWNAIFSESPIGSDALPVLGSLAAHSLVAPSVQYSDVSKPQPRKLTYEDFVARHLLPALSLIFCALALMFHIQGQKIRGVTLQAESAARAAVAANPHLPHSQSPWPEFYQHITRAISSDEPPAMMAMAPLDFFDVLGMSIPPTWGVRIDVCEVHMGSARLEGWAPSFAIYEQLSEALDAGFPKLRCRPSATTRLDDGIRWELNLTEATP